MYINLSEYLYINYNNGDTQFYLLHVPVLFGMHKGYIR